MLEADVHGQKCNELATPASMHVIPPCSGVKCDPFRCYMCKQVTVERNPYLIAAQTMTTARHSATFTQAHLTFFKSMKRQSNFLCAIRKGLTSLPEQLW
jgi:hypothetical protein